MGPDVDPGRDRVTVDGKPLRWDETLRYLAYHKTAGSLVSRRSQGGHPTIFDLLGATAHGLHAVGRLDLESEGLLLLTNDGVLFSIRETGSSACTGSGSCRCPTSPR